MGKSAAVFTVERVRDLERKVVDHPFSVKFKGLLLNPNGILDLCRMYRVGVKDWYQVFVSPTEEGEIDWALFNTFLSLSDTCLIERLWERDCYKYDSYRLTSDGKSFVEALLKQGSREWKTQNSKPVMS